MKNDLPTLDGWRAAAIALVLFAHLQLPAHALQRLAPYGALGVHLFFALSGFLITHRLLAEEHARGRIRLRAFYIRRAFRILPGAFTYLAVLCVLGYVLHLIPLTSGQLASSVFFFRNYWVEPAAQSWYTGHYWSLSVEEHFYLLWPALLVLIGKRRAIWAVPVLACLFALWRGLDSHYQWIGSLHAGWMNLVGRTDYRFDGLLWGCAAALLWEPLRLRAKAWHATTAIAAMTLLLIFQPPGYVSLLALLMPLPLVATAADPSSRLGRLLENPAVAWFGRLSYSVYLWQMLFLPAYGIPVSLGILQRFPLNLLLVLLAASASYYCVERPLRQAGTRWAGSLRAQPVSIVDHGERAFADRRDAAGFLTQGLK